MDKKCSICGGDLTEFGSRDIKDGIVCRYCVKKASPWLRDEDYLCRDIKAIKSHLKYREKNQKIIDVFEPERTIEGKFSLYLNRSKGQFVVSKRRDYKKDNADVLYYKDIKDLSIIEEKDETGNYNLLINIELKNKDLNNVCFRVNEFPGIEKGSKEYEATLTKAYEYLNGFDEEDGIYFVEV